MVCFLHFSIFVFVHITMLDVKHSTPNHTLASGLLCLELFCYTRDVRMEIRSTHRWQVNLEALPMWPTSYANPSPPPLEGEFPKGVNGATSVMNLWKMIYVSLLHLVILWVSSQGWWEGGYNPNLIKRRGRSLLSICPMHPIILTLIVPLLTFWLFRWFIRITNSSSVKSLPFPPGPKGLPIIGNVFDVPLKMPWKQFHEWSKIYGTHVLLPQDLDLT